VIGSDVIHLNLCGCVKHPLDVVKRWGQEVAAQLTSSGPLR